MVMKTEGLRHAVVLPCPPPLPHCPAREPLVGCVSARVSGTACLPFYHFTLGKGNHTVFAVLSGFLPSAWFQDSSCRRVVGWCIPLDGRVVFLIYSHPDGRLGGQFLTVMNKAAVGNGTNLWVNFLWYPAISRPVVWTGMKLVETGVERSMRQGDQAALSFRVVFSH